MSPPDPAARTDDPGAPAAPGTVDANGVPAPTMRAADPADPPTQPLAVLAPGRRRSPASTPWTFVDVFAGLGVVLLLSLMMGAALQFADSNGGNATLLLGALPVWAGLLGTAVWVCRRHGTGSLIRDLALRFRPVDLAIGLGVGLGLRFAIGAWAVLYSSITGEQPTSNLESVLGNGLGTGLWLVVNMTAIALIGPVIEEIFFRGVGLRSALASLLRRSDDPRLSTPGRRARAAIAVTALIFALLHISEVTDVTSAVVLLPGLFLAGWVLARLTIRSGRLGPAIVTHVVFNAVAVVALLFLQ